MTKVWYLTVSAVIRNTNIESFHVFGEFSYQYVVLHNLTSTQIDEEDRIFGTYSKLNECINKHLYIYISFVN